MLAVEWGDRWRVPNWLGVGGYGFTNGSMVVVMLVVVQMVVVVAAMVIVMVCDGDLVEVFVW